MSLVPNRAGELQRHELIIAAELLYYLHLVSFEHNMCVLLYLGFQLRWVAVLQVLEVLGARVLSLVVVWLACVYNRFLLG